RTVRELITESEHRTSITHHSLLFLNLGLWTLDAGRWTMVFSTSLREAKLFPSPVRFTHSVGLISQACS
ncbi:hypothetical protein KAX14_06015, partial [Candidatus Bipolaricaulota bacterium]|nr:hypothetical protein [Candidatus Bipolaricaulota bacterium]